MPLNPKTYEFLERTKASGVPDQSIVGIFTARGWPEKEVYEALAGYYERQTGIEIPHRRGGGTAAAKDAFYYLLVFTTLATWAFGLSLLSFTLIEGWFADPLFTANSAQPFDTFSIAVSIACILIAFPIYLLVSRAVLRDVRTHPEKSGSPVRKWLTYMALVIAASIFIGDLITALTYLLRGEITSRFLAKVLVVGIISGGVFFYYFFGLKKPEETALRKGLSRDTWMAGLSTLGVAVMVVVGFTYIGGPGKQRLLRADGRRVQDLYQLSQSVDTFWRTHENELPNSLADLTPPAAADPLTRAPYTYTLLTSTSYNLCASFSLASPPRSESSPWRHPEGSHCFTFDTAHMPQPPYYPYE